MNFMNKNSITKRLVFWTLLALLPVILITLVEAGLRIFHYGDQFSLFEQIRLYNISYKRCRPDYGKKYFYHLPYTKPRNDLFLEIKPKNSYRVFVIGSSTAYGFPYGAGDTFSAILKEKLRDSYPHRTIEVVNTAITATNSFTFADIIDEILENEPDAIIFYEGHNEFYGALGISSTEAFSNVRWLKRLHLSLLDLKIYQLVRSVIFAVSNRPVEDNGQTTLLERIAVHKNIDYKSSVYQKAHEHFKLNLEYIIKKTQQKHVPFIISELVSNIKDQKPFCSAPTGEFPAAQDVYNKAVEFENRQQYDQAREYYYRAKDYDCIRFRASEETNDIIRQLAREKSLILVPMQHTFEGQSVHGLIGDNLMAEYLHPNIDGYFLMAEAFFKAIADNKLAGACDSSFIKPISYYRATWGFTSLDSLYAKIVVQCLKYGWPFTENVHKDQFFKEYQITSYADSLAYMAVRYSDITLEGMHEQMARYYLEKNDRHAAYQEYVAAMHINPYNLQYYFQAGDILLEMQQYQQALKIYLSALSVHRDALALAKTGEIYLKLGQYKKAIEYLVDVRRTDPAFLTYNVLEFLRQAYAGDQQPDQARSVESQMASLKPKSDNNDKMVVTYAPEEIENSIRTAIKLLKARQLDQAIALLYRTNAQKETPVGLRLLGEALLQMEDKRALPLLKKAYPYFDSDVNFLNGLCYAGIRFGDKSLAVKILGEIKHLSPGNANIERFEQLLSQKQ
jgi:tetratricopeptide (TPR) repeat protein